MKVFPSAVARDDPNFTCAAAVLISYIHLASKAALSPSQGIRVKWPRRSANNAVPPNLRTCQESQEQRRDEWGWVKSLDVDAGRATAWTKELPQQRRSVKRRSVKRPRRCGTFTLVQTRLLACRSCNCHATNVHGGESPQWLALAFTAVKMCSRGCAESQKWLQPQSATSKCPCDVCSVKSSFYCSLISKKSF